MRFFKLYTQIINIKPPCSQIKVEIHSTDVCKTSMQVGQKIFDSLKRRLA